MRAEILNRQTSFEIAPALKRDGTIGAPERVTIRTRPCWRKPVAEMDLRYLYESEDIVYYQVIGYQELKC